MFVDVTQECSALRRELKELGTRIQELGDAL